MGGEPLRMRTARCGAVTQVDRDRQVAVPKSAAPGVPPGSTGDTRWLDAAWSARKPRVQHDPLAGVRTQADSLVPEDVRERHQRRQRIVAGAVEQDLLHIG